VVHSTQPKAKPRAGRPVAPGSEAGENGGGRVERPDDPAEAEDPTSDVTPPMPRPAFRIEERGGGGSR